MFPRSFYRLCAHNGNEIFFNGMGEARAADNLALQQSHRNRRRKRSRNEDLSYTHYCRNATAYIKIFARLQFNPSHKKSPTVFLAHFAASTVERFALYSSAGQRSLRPKFTVRAYITTRIHKFSASSETGEARAADNKASPR